MYRFATPRRIALALAAVAVLGLAGPAAAGEQVPFHGVLEGDFTTVPVPNTPTATLVVSANGIASPLGLFELEIPHLVNFATMSATGSYQFTAVNGDKVYATFTGHATPIGTDGAYVLVTEEATITGGTGRFAGATGEFTAVRLVDRVNSQTIGYIDGTISRPRRR